MKKPAPAKDANKNLSRIPIDMYILVYNEANVRLRNCRYHVEAFFKIIVFLDLLNAVRLSSTSITTRSHTSAESNVLGLESCSNVDPIAVVHKDQV